MLKRYIGPAEEVEVMIGGESFGVVSHGDAIPIPDDVANSLSWSEVNWEDVASTTNKDGE